MERKYGRLELFDDQSRRYSIMQFVRDIDQQQVEPRSMVWDCSVVLNQGSEGSCVGHAWAHELAAEPAPVAGVTHEAAVEIYYDAQRNDPWPGGEYPGATPNYSGSSVLGGAKACMMRGLVGGYYWAFGIDELILGIGYHGPSVLGIRWYKNMNTPDANNQVRPTGNWLGGHAILACGVDIENEHIILHNSWGPGWGDNGRCYIKFTDMSTLLKDGGEACFALGRRTKPMEKPIGYN